MASTTTNLFALVQAAFTARSWFSDNSITILNEDQPDTPESVEAKMESPGAVVVISQPRFARVENGRVNITMVIEIYENMKINREAGGTTKECAEIAENAWAALEGYTHGDYPQFSEILPQSLEFDWLDLGQAVATVTINTSSGLKVTEY